MIFRHCIYCTVIIMFKLVYSRNIKDLKDHFASKTPYSTIKNLSIYRSEYKAFGKPCKIWMVIRHGTRHASAKQIEKMNTKLPPIRKKIMKLSKKHLSESDMKLFGRARTKFSQAYASKLTLTGKCEMTSLARRMQQSFPQLFISIYDDKVYQFRLTHASRTFESAKHFCIGLFGNDAVTNKVSMSFIEDDVLLRFYRLCSKWQTEIRRNSSSLDETTLFKKTDAVMNILSNVNKKLGLADFLTFGNVTDDIHSMYNACITQTCNNKLTAWCIPLDLNTVKLLEFFEDLKHYWLDGYGFELTYKQACPLFKNMVEFLSSEEQYPTVVLNFTHSGALLKLICHLQLYKDEKPLKHDYYNICENRKWRLSKIGGFGSNLAFLLYRVNEEYKVLVLHQEKIIRLPCCPDDDLCALDIIKQHYVSSLTDCNFNRICSNS